MPAYIDYRALKESFTLNSALDHYDHLRFMTEKPDGRLQGPCPIHSTETTGTSFKVTASKRGFRCFGCGAQGNVLDFVAAMESVDVHEAAETIYAILAEREAAREQKTTRDAYAKHVYSQVPVYSTRLVRVAELDLEEYPSNTTPEAIFGFIRPYFQECDREEFVVVLLDTALRITGLATISTGGLRAAIVEPAQVFKAAILGNAESIVLAHNHPSGRCEPSAEDRAITHQIAQCGKMMGIPVRDHLIVSAYRYTSFAERGLIERV